MAKSNPFVGGPDYIRVLSNALGGKAQLWTEPPSTGGTQFSIRLRPGRLAITNQIADHTKWNRTQVIDALLQAALVQLFDSLSPKAAEGLMTAAVSKASNEER
jgi:hypothetical protein